MTLCRRMLLRIPLRIFPERDAYSVLATGGVTNSEQAERQSGRISNPAIELVANPEIGGTPEQDVRERFRFGLRIHDRPEGDRRVCRAV